MAGQPMRKHKVQPLHFSAITSSGSQRFRPSGNNTRFTGDQHGRFVELEVFFEGRLDLLDFESRHCFHMPDAQGSY